MTPSLEFKELTVQEFLSRKRSVDLGDALSVAQDVVGTVRVGGSPAIRAYAERWGDLLPGESAFVTFEEQESAWQRLPQAEKDLLQRCYDRIFDFATRQRISLSELKFESNGFKMGHVVLPVESCACYVPGGRFPLVSSLLMTVATARAAGVKRIVVLNPRPAAVTLAAAHMCGVHDFLKIGGAQAIAASAFGFENMSRCDMVVGPGNRYVAAAKATLAADIGIDMVAGPSELLVVCDASASVATVAADLLGQAEHDPDAVPLVVAIGQVNFLKLMDALEQQLKALPTAETARAALKNGGFVRVNTVQEAAGLCNAVGPEHLELCFSEAPVHAPLFTCYGGLFVGTGAAEVLGDYGAGPNHVLPTAGTARWSGGLSVFHFLKTRTFMEAVNGPESQNVVRDAAQLARLEGLEAHARSAEHRLLDQRDSGSPHRWPLE